MKRKVLSLLMAAVLAIGLLPTAFAGYENFSAQAAYTGQFTDVPADEWYYENVRAAYEYGLIDGRSETQFAPDGTLTVAEAIKMAATIHSIYQTGSADFAVSDPWYLVYVDYALENGILSAARTDYNTSASRAVFASVLAGALPAGKLGELVLLGACAALGAAVYFLLAGLLRLEEMELARSFWKKLRKRG